jgi:hypothetical protein
MLDFYGLDARSMKEPLLISVTVRPDEVELALATNGESLRERVLLALVSELTTVETAEPSGFLARLIPWNRTRDCDRDD